MAYQVTAPLVIAKTAEGVSTHVYEGGFLPDEMDADQLAQLIADEMVTEADAPADPEESDAPADPEESGAGDEKPANSASKGKWVTYAVTQGHDEVEVEAMKKDDIVALFGD